MTTYHVRRTDDTDYETIQAVDVNTALCEFYLMHDYEDRTELEVRAEGQAQFAVFTVVQEITTTFTGRFEDEE